MKNILIVGAGNIGSRHAESIVNLFKNKFHLDIVENSTKSKTILKKRLSLKKNIFKKQVKIKQNFDNLLNYYDVIIVATTSIDRDEIIKLLLKKTTFKNIILEKIVFSNINNYQYFIKLFKKKQINCWVNCPNRFNESYNYLKKIINKNKSINMIVEGSSWGLASNFVHYTDLFFYFIDKNFVLNNFKINSKIINSKRKGFVEFNGSFSLYTKRGDLLMINHYKSLTKKMNVNVYFKNDKLSFIFNQNNDFAYLQKNHTSKLKKIKFKIPLQSQLTAAYCKSIFQNNTVNLPTLEEHYIINKSLFRQFLKFYKKNTKSRKNILPIT